MVTYLTLVRHGNNFDYGKEEAKYPGPGLTSKGKKQSELTGKYLKDSKFDVFLCSDMTRAIETAKIINKYQKMDISFHRELSEFNRIVFEDNSKDIEKLKINKKRALISKNMLRTILKKYKNKRILIVGHGNVFRSWIGFAFGLAIAKSPRQFFFNCTISNLAFGGEELVGVGGIGLTDHLKKIKSSDRFKDKTFW